MTRTSTFLLLWLLAAGTGLGQVALYDFNGNLDSSDTDPNSVASPISTPQNFILASGNFCATSDWLQTTPQGPFNSSPNYLEFTVTPNTGKLLSYVDMVFTTQRGGGIIDYVEFAGIYADQDPGPLGDNFTTLIDTIDLFPQASGVGLVTVDLTTTTFLQSAAGPVTFRIYMWGDQNSCCSNAEIRKIEVDATDDDCPGPPAAVVSMPSCNDPLDPVLTLTPFAVGQSAVYSLTSQFPNALGWIIASIGPFQPLTYMGCTFWIDLLNLNNLWIINQFDTDAAGSYTFDTNFTITPDLIGIEIWSQVRLCIPGGPPGPIFPLPDFFSNGVLATIGCP